MFKRLINIRNKRIIGNKVEDFNKDLENCVLFSSLEKNIETISRLFEDVDILRLRHINNNYNKNLKYCIVYCDGVVNSSIMNDNLIKPLLLSKVPVSEKESIDTILNQIVQINETEKTNKLKDIVQAIAYGSTVLFVSGASEAIILNTKNFQARAITEPENEKNLSGPREGFAESLMTNLSLIRRKVLTPELKMKFYTLGRRTRVKACICYMDGIVNKQILEEVYRRLDTIDIDAVLDTNYIAELIKDYRLSPFRTTGSTERPDVVIGKLMEGRVAIFLDGTPYVLTVPYLFIENFQSSDDYYISFFYSSFSRMIRIIGFFLTISIPGIYICVVAFHHDIMPMHLFTSIAFERQSVPLPAALEAFFMILVFDLLKETGVRMPANIGQALSIVGALVIGQAAVEAKLVAAPMIIIIAITGITNLLVPKINSAVIYIRLFLLLLSSVFGFFGLTLGFSIILIHVINLRSFGIPQLSISGNMQYQQIKDTFIRAPFWQMILRPRFAKDKVRINTGGNSHD